tara:strand:- start:18880 stop:20160 length:1281 start_codon:yes stop_codon:yes gene_type:complete
MKKNYKIGVIGLGYVGLPLAVAFAEKYNVIGYDINLQRVEELNDNYDSTLEISTSKLKEIQDLKSDNNLLCTPNKIDLENCNVYIITVPTPIDSQKKPNLKYLIDSSKLIGKFLNKNDIVIYESTVYPGLTEEEMVPILEIESNLVYNKDFFVGYSPERINPGDKTHTLTNIKKITSGSNPIVADEIDNLYKSIITAGTFKAKNIKVAEAAKVIENSQRDINIAFVNELSKIFNLLNIDTKSVLEAASTKWNFLNFSPGLVGGHCIGVDPYYLAQKAQDNNYHPEIILAGRRINDSMGKYVATELIKKMIHNNKNINRSKILILGFTFKENCPDFRNTRVIDIIQTLESYTCNVDVYDPWIKKKDVLNEFKNLNIIDDPKFENYDSIVIAVAHDKFIDINFKGLIEKNIIIYDVKGILNDNKTISL